MLERQGRIHYHYTKAELKQLLKSMVVLVDTREQKNNHITEYLSRYELPFKSKKLDFGDYSFMLPESPKLGIVRDIYFSNQIAVERKASLEELSNNLAQNRARFEAELIRAKGAGAKVLLLVENGTGYEDILRGRYNTRYKPKSFLGSLLAFQARYNLDIRFLDSSLSGNFIYHSLKYFCREYLK